ncbi:MAG: hypothetical protein GQ536_03370 [Candidatus Aminicenantes bacterium]|nr:hypothetical protein [Candidatus Aminicenantes bacterium]
MSKSTKTLALGIFILACLSLFALAVDVSGTWEMTAQTQRGDWNSEMKIEQDGEKITVTMEGFQGNEMKGEGVIKDNKIEWTVTMSTQRGDFSISYTGTVEGDTMSGEAQMGDFGSMEWTAKKKK